MNPEAIRKVYGRFAGLYDILFGPVADSGRKKVVAQINKLPPSKILEVGVGTGISLAHYDSKHQISAIDISPEMLARARKRVAEHNLSNVSVVAEMDAQKMDFADGEFDVVVAMYVMSVVPDPDKVLREMQRVCRPGGKIFIANHFSREGGMLERVERFLEPYADRIGWQAHFPLDVCLEHEGMKVHDQRRVPPLGLFTVLVCENNGNDEHYAHAPLTNGGVGYKSSGAHAPTTISVFSKAN